MHLVQPLTSCCCVHCWWCYCLPLQIMFETFNAPAIYVGIQVSCSAPPPTVGVSVTQQAACGQQPGYTSCWGNSRLESLWAAP
jgi:hypothetical protein